MIENGYGMISQPVEYRLLDGREIAADVGTPPPRPAAGI